MRESNTVDRTDAYEAVAVKLNELADYPFDRLVGLIGEVKTEFCALGPDTCELEWWVSWANPDRTRLRISAWLNRGLSSGVGVNLAANGFSAAPDGIGGP